MNKLSRWLFYSLYVIIFLSVFASCENTEEREVRLAKQYCSSCHLFPEPGLLDKKTWMNSVLPRMGLQLGLNTFDYQSDVPVKDILTFLSTIPPAPVIKEDEWKSIKSYYVKNAPESLSTQPNEKLEETTQFETSKFRLNKNEQPLITLLHADTKSSRVYVGTRTGWLYQLTNQFEVLDSIYTYSAPSHIKTDKDGIIEVLLMGIMDPNDQPAGTLVQVDYKNRKMNLLIDSLKRPVHFEKADLNADGLDDYIICAFGNITGALLVYENQGNQRFKKRILNAQPGTRKVFVRDFTGDGKPDIVALLAQADEKVMLFTNEGDFKFKPSNLVRFPSVYGSSDFDIADFNHDGHFDFVTTQGDNADFSIILKPYHGVRVFLNDGKNNFSQSWFYPMHGASEVKAADFDGDGDTDIAAITFFPDFTKEPRNSFLYFENTGKEFKPFTTSLANSGRWLVMDASDIDNDGDKDLLLGALNFKPLVPDSIFNDWNAQGASLLILRNRLQ
ncbi:MAG: VCBS repeat-containing protein [Cyclobacteriaceae bacterium]|nr:VCBS repeat-containing protein [Cyclobacteriaceae bacterium]